jgi:hypothetical protein
MKKHITLILILLIFSYCAPKQKKAERITEDGVEVIGNYLELYQIKDETIAFTFKEEFMIDSESENFAELGNVKTT